MSIKALNIGDEWTDAGGNIFTIVAVNANEQGDVVAIESIGQVKPPVE